VSKDKPRALGRGLDALLPVTTPREAGQPARTGVFVCPIEKLVPQKGQPRQHFDEALLTELSDSIRDRGLIEPIVVRRAPGVEERYEIIAGERRWRASQRAGLHEVPVVVKDVSPLEAFELALIENVQRADLNPIELAEALDRLLREHSYTHENLAGLLKKDRSTISNALRLLKLPARVRSLVIEGRLTEGHARSLLGVAVEKEVEIIADKIVRGGLNVRQTEQLVKGAREKTKGKPAPTPPKISASVRDVSQRLSRSLGTRVELRDKDGKGEIAIAYGSLDELDRLIELLEK
jgi:ParB family chromosome partitioning protein